MNIVSAMPHPVSLAPFPWFDLVIIIALVALNGLFAMSELAIVSARRARLEAMARTGKRGAGTALAGAGHRLEPRPARGDDRQFRHGE